LLHLLNESDGLFPCFVIALEIITHLAMNCQLFFPQKTSAFP